MMKQYIIDWNSIFCKIYYGFNSPWSTQVLNSKWIPTEAIFWFLRFLNHYLLSGVPRDNLHITFDNKTSKTPRKEKYLKYKDWRSQTPESFITQMNYLQNLLVLEWLHVYSFENLEADDICFKLAYHYSQQSQESLIITRDKDLLLSLVISNYVNVLYDTKNKLYTQQSFLDEYEFPITYYLSYKSILGDTSDNIPWIKWVWEIWAKSFLKELYSHNITLNSLLQWKESQESILSSKSLKVLEKIKWQIDNYNLARELITPIQNWELPSMNQNIKNDIKVKELYDFLEIQTNRLR